ncbi:MAG: dockerin type I repeat-containing protein [Planctomycetota bacterium]
MLRTARNVSPAKSEHRQRAVLWLCAMLAFGVSGSLRAQDPNYVIRVTDAAGASGASVVADVRLDSTGAPIQGWSFGICHDPAFVTLNEAWDGATTLTVKNGGPPDFNVLTYYPNGFIKAVLVCFTSCATLPPGLNYHLNSAEYQLDAVAPMTTELHPCSTLGVPVVPVKVVVAGLTISATRVFGTLTASDAPPFFARGDANGDGSVNIADALNVLEHLFIDSDLNCMDAADANDSGIVDVSDAVLLLGYLFVSGMTLPAPSPDCGTDSTGSAQCDWSGGCP